MSTCGCVEAAVFGHLPLCPVTPQSQPACTVGCTSDACWDHCRVWRAQRVAFGWPVPANTRKAAV